MKSLFSPLVDEITEMMKPVCDKLAALPLDQQVEALNQARLMLHQSGPFSEEPVDCVVWKKSENIVPNQYNPNKVAPPEMRLLKRSMNRSNITMPVVVYSQDAPKQAAQPDSDLTIVDGAHRSKVVKEDKTVRARTHGYTPVSLVFGKHDNDLMAATITHNRARGVHGVVPMTEIVAVMIKNGWTDEMVAQELGMDADEVLRFKHNTGLPELFKDHSYSPAWK